MAAAAQRPHQYLTGPTRTEELARQIAERDGITEGLVGVFSVREPCRTFSLVWKEAHPFVQPAWRKCLHLYFYFVDRQLGLIHVKLQTWFPFPIQVQSGAHVWHGFTNRDLREKLARASFPLAADPAKHSGQITRLLRRLPVHQLIAKIPHSRRWRVSLNGRRVMAAAVKLREVAYPGFYATAA